MKQKVFTYCLCLIGLTLGVAYPIAAQVTSDGSLPVPTRVTQSSGNAFIILDGTQQGGNLFHSFSQFSVPTGGSAFFNTSQYSGIQNILGRVTGGSLSTIDGLIRASGTANLFLLNPNGFVFGANARLQIGGSFLATTGSSLRFADGAELSATAPAASVLTVSVPIGVQFGSNPSNIRVAGSNLQNTGRTIGLLGGEVTIEGGNRGLAGNTIISASGGRIELGGVGSNSFVGLTFVDRGFTLGYDQVQTFQPIKIIQNVPISANNGGEVKIQGSQIQLTDGSQIGGNFSLPSGSINLTASESVELLGTGIYQLAGRPTEINTGVFNQTSGAGSAGTITIDTKQLIVRDGALISASTSSFGQGGNLIVNASESVEVSGVSATNPTTLFSGISVASNRTATGDAGNLLINTQLLTVKNGGQISATTFGRGQGGTLTVNANDVQLIGGSATQVNGLFAQSGSSAASANNANATGQGGNLTVNTNNLLVQNGARISTGTFGAGEAGNLVINADTMRIVGQSSSDRTPSLVSASSSSAGAAGNLSITANRLTVENGGTIAVSASGSGVAGDLQISAPFILLDNQGKLTAETRAGQGNITLTTSDLRLRRNSLISTNATGTATGGNISISTQTLVALENSDITANAEESFGGRVSIQAVAVFGTEFRTQLTPDSDITATSALGPQFSGFVTIQTPGIDPSQGLVQLQTNVVDLSRLVVQACSRNSQRATSEFFVTGRGGLPPSPTDAVGETRILDDLGQPRGDRSTQHQISSMSPTGSLSSTGPLEQAQGWIINPAGKVTLVAQSSLPGLQPPGFILPPCKEP